MKVLVSGILIKRFFFVVFRAKPYGAFQDW